MLRRVARAIVDRYPQVWRERYADEVSDLIESGPVRLYDVGELFHGMLVERVRAAIDVERPSVAMAKLNAYKTMSVIATLVAIQAGGWTLRYLWPVYDERLDVAKFAALGFWLALFAFWVTFSLMQVRKLPDDRRPFPVWLAAAALPLHLASASVFLWSGLVHANNAGDYVIAFYNNAYGVSLISLFLLMHIWPGRRLVDAIVEADGAENAVRGAESQIVNCREWIAKGVPSPVADWERELVVRIEKRDAALTRLKAMGYRARFGA